MEILVANDAKVEPAGLAERWTLIKDIGVSAILALLPILFFWRFLTPNAADAISLPTGDLINLNYPYRLFETRELLQGRLPLWNPYVFSGTSSLGDIQYGIFYPLNLISSLLLGRDGFPPVDLAIQIAAHFSLAAIFTYLFARRLFGNRTAAIVSALVFTYSGYLTSFPVQQIMILETSIWLPLILLFLDKGIVDRSFTSFVLAGAFTAAAILAGHPQTLMYVLVGALAYAGFRIWTLAQKGNRHSPQLAADFIRVNWRIALLGCITFLFIAFGLAAIQLIPSYDHLQLTERTAINYEFVERGFHLRELVGLVFPTNSGGSFMYIGILPLILIPAGFLARNDIRQKLFWLVLAGLALIFSFGGQTFLHTVAYLIVPGFKFFRDQERTVFLTTFAAAILSGYGAKVFCDALVGSEYAHEVRRRLAEHANLLRWSGFLIAAFALAAFLSYVDTTGDQKKSLADLSDRAFFTLALFALSAATLYIGWRQPSRPNLTAMLMVSIIAFDLFSSNWHNNVQLPKPPELYPITKTISRINADKTEPFRIASEGLLAGHGNAGIVYGLEDIVGDSPLELHQHLTFEKNVDEVRRWQLLNVKYVLTKRKLDDPRFTPVIQENEINTYEIAPNLRLPRAFIVHKAIVAASEDDQLRATKAIEPHTEVVLPKDPQLELSEQASSESKVDFVERGPQKLELRTSSATNGVLVLSEVFYPGWKAFVDGRPTEIMRGDYILRAVPIEQGTHTVEFVYDSSSLKLGMTISSVSAIIALVVIAVSAIMSLRSRRLNGDNDA